MADKCHEAFYGARARSRRNTVKAHVSPGERPQEIFTPESVLQVLEQAWGGIRLDACGHPDAIVRADEIWTGHPVDTGRRRKDGSIVTEWAGPGLLHPWPDRTYWNPPFCDLEQWIAHAERQAGRWCGLYPARTSRKWCRAQLTTVDGICWLNPLKFVGYDQANPDRLVLAYRGPDVALIVAATPPELGEWTGPLQRL